MVPSALTKAPYRTDPSVMPSILFVNRRWISRPASGPVTSYLHVEKRSQIPVAVRIASYSTPGSVPSCIAQGYPSSQITSAPCAMCQSCSGDRTSVSPIVRSFLGPDLASGRVRSRSTARLNRGSSQADRPVQVADGRVRHPRQLAHEDEEQLRGDQRVVEGVVGRRHGHAEALGGLAEPVAALDTRPGVPAVDGDREVPDVEQTPAPPTLGPAVDPPKERDLDLGEPRQ